MKAAINDIVSDSLTLSYEEVRKIDSVLSENKIATLSSMRKGFLKKYKKILLSKKISNVGEYYLIKNVFDDTGVKISEDERSTISLLMNDFEKKSTLK